jgi:hypothetical protein
MPDDQPSSAYCNVTQSRVKILGRADGGKEFISPAMRNFREKLPFTIFLLVLAVVFTVFVSIITDFVGQLPFAWARFIAVNFLYFFLGILGLFLLLFGFICFDLWLRSSRAIAVAGELRLVTHWLLLKRTNIIPVSKIIEIKAANNITVNDTSYYDIMVLTEGNGQNWLAAIMNPNGIPDVSDSFTENDRKVLASGGKNIRAITNIIGETEANWILEEMNTALGRK